MNIKIRATIAALATVVLLPLGFQLTADSAQAQEHPASCEATNITEQASDIGDKQLIISAHGYWSDAATWGKRDQESCEGSMHQAIDAIDNTYYYAFDYEDYNQQWVNDPNIGPKLADTIACLAQLSRDGGGNGKVVVLTHSMGGLAARYAADIVGNDIGLVITIGTPHHGSAFGNLESLILDTLCPKGAVSNFIVRKLDNNALCTGNQASQGLAKWASDMRELPDFPDSVPVKAIAGNISLYFSFEWWNRTLKTGSDTIVGVESATHQYTTDFQMGDGKRIVDCTSQIHHIASAPCQHSGMLRGSEVQQEVVSSIEAFIEANQPEPNEGVQLDVFGKLSVPMDGINYEELDAEMPGLEYKIADTTECLGDDTCPYVSFIDTEGAGAADVYQYMSMHGCMMDTGSGSAPPESVRQIGGKDVIFTESYNGYHNYTSYCWLGIEHELSVLARTEGAVPFDPTRWQKAFDDEECEWL